MRNNAIEPLYAVQECFYSFQGEGVHMGRPAFFVRLMGCDQCCDFCDSAATWHKDWKPTDALRLSAAQIVNRVKDSIAPLYAKAVYDSDVPFVVLTGGEPALYDLQPLVHEIQRLNLAIHIETAGHRPLPSGLTWTTVSPKFFATPPLQINMEKANEIKLICTSPQQLQEDFAKIRAMVERRFGPMVWLHPEWSQRENRALLQAITEMVKAEPGVRAGYQLHKLYKADLLDPQSSKVTVPLGGEANGGSSQ